MNRKMYLVWNESTAESEFFGATKSKKRAERLLKKIKKQRYPNMTEEEVVEEEVKTGESIKIALFDNLIK